MWALRRAGNPLRVRAHQALSARGCANLEVILNADAKNVEEHHEGDCQKLDCCHQPKPLVCQPSFSSGRFMWSRGFSSQAGASSGDKQDELEEGFSDLEVPPEAHKKDLDLTSDESSDEDTIDAIGLSEVEADAKPEEPIKKSQSTLLKALLESPRVDVAGALKKWLNDGNTLDRSELFYVLLILRRRKLYIKALQLLEYVEESKLIDLGERDYASRVDLVAKTHSIYKAEKYIENVPASHRGEIVYRTLLANCVAIANVKKAEQVFNKMKDLGFPVSVFSCNQLLLLYKRVDKKKLGDVLTMMEKENVKPSLFTYKLLVDTKGAARDIEDMEKVIQAMQADGIEPDLLFQATIARHYIFGGYREKAEAILEQMVGDDINENRSACKFVLPLYAFLGKNDDVERIWKVCEANARLDECMSAIEAFGKLGDVEKAEEIFDNMFKTWKTLSSKYYNAMLKVYANKKLFDKGKELAKRMGDDGCRLGPYTLDSLVKLYSDAGEVEKADSILHKLSYKNKIKPMYTTYLMLLDSYSKKGDVHNAEKLFSKVRQMGYTGRIRQYQLLLEAYLNAKTPPYGFKERMKADDIFPNRAVASLLAATDPFNRKNAMSELLD
ncbi:pentatricopeptide repeat-containing protein At1g80270, mitochondrial-like [Oryza glaberrima]|uniref:PROP1-like PPR domain-containing protein n=1 Tax=Oryza glaberrima TaxID=4538 RepID=I1R4E8_ORYGL|nr:pentatricopeptide repeat-containing protein At1g80270, mitochondrial-like [Oryza glaberrima]XP_052138691.1 pentatricopeptide repeat-containing protein At1g80270, mitochondrial-like [Oryza glaberrima]